MLAEVREASGKSVSGLIRENIGYLQQYYKYQRTTTNGKEGKYVKITDPEEIKAMEKEVRVLLSNSRRLTGTEAERDRALRIYIDNLKAIVQTLKNPR